jgi:hypothetical protein
VENVGQIIEFALQGEQIGRMGNRKNAKKAGEQIMKKALFSVLIVLFLLWNFGAVSAQGAGKGKGVNKKEEQAKKLRGKNRGGEAGAYEPGAREKRKQVRKKKEFDRLREDRLKKREMRLKGKGKFKAGKGKSREQQLESLRKRFAHEEAKHNRRLARLRRIQQLGVEHGKKNIADKVAKLLQKEENRYSRKKRLLERHERMLSIGRSPKARRPRDKNVGEKGGQDVKKRFHKEKYKARGGRGGKKAEQ